MSVYNFSLEKDPKGGPLDDFFSILHNIRSYNFVIFFACLSLLLLWLGLFNIIRYKYLYTRTHWGTAHVLCHQNEHSAQTELVVVVAMPCTQNQTPQKHKTNTKISTLTHLSALCACFSSTYPGLRLITI